MWMRNSWVSLTRCVTLQRKQKKRWKTKAESAETGCRKVVTGVRITGDVACCRACVGRARCSGALSLSDSADSSVEDFSRAAALFDFASNREGPEVSRRAMVMECGSVLLERQSGQ